MSTKYAEKIAALLAKAENTDNAEEAEAFSAAAERLMLKWGVEDAMVEAARTKTTGATREAIIRRTVELSYTYRKAYAFLGHYVAVGMGGIKVIHTTSWDKSEALIVVGHESDVARFVQLFESLVVQAESAMRAWWKTQPRSYFTQSEGFLARRQFIISFGSAVNTRLRDERTRVVEETTGAELVLIDREALVKREVDKLFPSLKSGRGIKGGTYGARTAGRAAGMTANLGSGRKTVTA